LNIVIQKNFKSSIKEGKNEEKSNKQNSQTNIFYQNNSISYSTIKIETSKSLNSIDLLFNDNYHYDKPQDKDQFEINNRIMNEIFDSYTFLNSSDQVLN